MLHNQRVQGFLLASLIFSMLGVLAACAGPSAANRADTDYTDRQQEILARGQPTHLYDYSQDRGSFLAIYDARVQGKATYSVSVPQNGGHPWYECPSRGYPIPADTQLTNPDRIGYSNGGTAMVIPQAEPNGLYSGHGAGGTYMQCVDTDGSLYTVYSEPHVLTFPFAVVWKGDHYEKANPNDRASYTLPAPPVNPAAPSTFTLPAPGATPRP